MTCFIPSCEVLFTAKCRSPMNNDMSSYLTTFSVHIISCTCVTLFLLMTWPCVVSPASAVALLFAKCRALFRAIFSFWVSLWSRVHSILHAGRLRIFFMYIIYIYINYISLPWAGIGNLILRCASDFGSTLHQVIFPLSTYLYCLSSLLVWF